MYGCESWTIKKAERRRIDVLNCGVGEDSWESLDYKEIQPVHCQGDQSWIFIRGTDDEAETPILWPPDSFEKILMLGKIESKRKRGRQKLRWLDGITDSMDMSWRTLQEMVMDREAWHAAVMGLQSQTWLSDWTTTTRLMKEVSRFLTALGNWWTWAIGD